MSGPGEELGTTEEEVTFEEEVDRGSLTGHAPLPRYEYSAWLLLLPVLCALLLASNVRWRIQPRKATPRPAAKVSS